MILLYSCSMLLRHFRCMVLLHSERPKRFYTNVTALLFPRPRSCSDQSSSATRPPWSPPHTPPASPVSALRSICWKTIRLTKTLGSSSSSSLSWATHQQHLLPLDQVRCWRQAHVEREHYNVGNHIGLQERGQVIKIWGVSGSCEMNRTR